MSALSARMGGAQAEFTSAEHLKSMGPPDGLPSGDAGYAGSITSAAVDGIKVAEAVAAGHSGIYKE